MLFSPERKARIMIVDDHPLVREGVGMLVNRELDLVVCCAVDQLEEALHANRICPHDLAIVDMTLEGFSGMDVIRSFQSEFPDLPILVLSMHAESIYAEPVLKAGARGYLMKQSATSQLLQAIRTVLQGDFFVSDEMKNHAPRALNAKGASHRLIESLSPHELEVLHLVGGGLGTSEIADKLCRSVKTIESHKANIKKKLDLTSSTQLTLFAINLVSLGRQG